MAQHRIPIGPYELHRPIGHGGMGEVWKGVHVPQQMPVAIKVLTEEGARNQRYVDAFHNEARAVAALAHPAIVTVLDYGEIPAGAAALSEERLPAGSPYLVMELARRGSLKRYLHNLSWRELKAVVFTILDALAHAHAAGVVHRDLKPANILVGCGDDKRPGIKLTDFGLAHATDRTDPDAVTHSGWGTPQYMAPEQFRAQWRDFGPWTDLYALGITIYEMASGGGPYEAQTTLGFARAHMLLPPRPLAPRFALPDGFEAWLSRLLQKDPARRFQRAADAAWALQKLGDPPDFEKEYRTVSMMPVQGPAGDEPTMPPETAVTQRGKFLPDQTRRDRPDTTMLLPDELEELERDRTTPLSAIQAEFARTQLDLDVLSSPISTEVPPLPWTWRRPREISRAPKLLGAGIGLFGLRTIPMVDRHDERDLLWEELKRVRQEQTARAVLIRGAAGTGKSRLARWITRRADEVGSAVVLQAMHSPINGPGESLSRMMAHHLRCTGMTRHEAAARIGEVLERHDHVEELERSGLVELVVAGGPSDADDGAISFQFTRPAQRYAVVHRYLIRLAERRPVVVWLDDVQWGSDALAFASYVLRKQTDVASPILFLLTAREEALLERPVETALVGELLATRRCRVLDVEPLGPEDTDELVRELLLLEGDLADEVEARCGGNPLFAVQLVGDWVAGGKLQFGRHGFVLRAGEFAALPDDIHQIWSERLHTLIATLGEPARLPLEVAAALGQEVDGTEWTLACAEMGAQPPDALFQALASSGLAVPVEGGWQFCHGMFRESLERSSREAGRWRQVNTACAHMLEKRYPKRGFPFAERYANFLCEAGAANDALAPLLAASRARRERSEFEVAHRHLDRHQALVEGLDLDPSDPRRGEEWLERATLFIEQGAFEQAAQLADKAGAEARRHPWSALLPHALLVAGRARRFMGDDSHAHRALSRARELFDERSDRRGLAEALLGLGRVAQLRGQYQDAEQMLVRALALFEEVSDELGAARCLNARGDVARERGRFAQARAHTAKAKTLFDHLKNPLGVADCINDLAELHRLEGQLEEAIAACTESLQMYEALGSEQSMYVRVNLGIVLARSERFAEARQVLDEVRAHFEGASQTADLAAVNLHLLPCLAHLQEWDTWKRRLEEARAALQRSRVRNPDLLASIKLAAHLAREAGFDGLANEVERLRDQHLQ